MAYRLLIYSLGIVVLWTFSAHATRLITTTPLVTDLLTQLGKRSDIVAGNVSPSQANLFFPAIGPLFMPNAERTLLLSPDWVVSDPLTPALYLGALTTLGIAHLELTINTVDKLFSESQRVLKTIYGESRPRVLFPFQRCWKDALSLRRKPFRFLAFTWTSPPILFGSRSFLSDLLTQLGGKNAASRVDFDYPKVSEEWVLDQTVDYVFYLVDESISSSDVARQISRWWPKGQPKMVALPSRYFAQSNFAAWSSFKDLPVVKVPESCAKL
jgi:hypothetical protein